MQRILTVFFIEIFKKIEKLMTKFQEQALRTDSFEMSTPKSHIKTNDS